MKTLKTIVLGVLTVSLASIATAANVTSYSTSSSTLACGAAINCVQNGGNLQSIILGIGGATITLTYAPASDSNVSLPSFDSLGTITAVAANPPVSVSLVGIILTINIADATTGTNGNLVGVGGGGNLTDLASQAFISFGPDNTNTPLGGNRPGIILSGNGSNITYQVQSPVAVVPPGASTSIQGIITDSSVPEPSSMFLMGSALLGLGITARRKLKS